MQRRNSCLQIQIVLLFAVVVTEYIISSDLQQSMPFIVLRIGLYSTIIKMGGTNIGKRIVTNMLK